MGFIEESDVRQMLKEDGLVDEIVSSLVEDPKVLAELADDIADELEDLLEDDPTFRKKIIEAATANPTFKQNVIDALVADISD